MTVADAAPKRWLFGPAPDLLLGCGLLYMGFFAVVFAVGESRSYLPAFLAPLLVLIFSTPHYGATILRVYEQRAERRRYAVFSVWATLAIAAWFVVSQYWALAGSWMLTLYLTWSPWHYTGQNYGIALMLCGRRGVPLDARTKRWLHAAFVSSYALYLGVVHESATWATSRALPLAAEGLRFVPLGTPRWFTQAAMAACAVAVGGALVRLAWRAPLRDIGPSLLVVVSQLLWFVVPGIALHASLFAGREPLGADVQIHLLFWIAVAHSLQYLWVTAYYARAGSAWSGFRSYLLRTFAVGAALFTLPAILFAPGRLGTLGDEVAVALLINSAVNLHHFVLDGAIWKLRSGPIARVLIRSEAAAASDDAPGPPWQRRAVWSLAVACGSIAALVFVAEYWWVPRAIVAGDRVRAESLLDALAWVGRDSSRSRGHLAGLALQAGEPEEALAHFERSLALRPSLEASGAAIEVLVRLDRFEEAEARAEALLAASPDDPRVVGLAAAVYARVGRGEEAQALRERAQVLAANAPPVYAPDREPEVY